MSSSTPIISPTRSSSICKKNHNFGLRIEISREEELLDTGGGLKKASWFFAGDSRAISLA